MAPVLPIELQLHILELSVPLYTRRNFPEVRKLALTLPLVCRAWSSTAYRLLSPIAKIVYEAKEGEAEAFKLRVDALLACRSVEALDLNLTRWDQTDGLEYVHLMDSLEWNPPIGIWQDLPDTVRFLAIYKMRIPPFSTPICTTPSMCFPPHLETFTYGCPSDHEDPKVEALRRAWENGAPPQRRPLVVIEVRAGENEGENEGKNEDEDDFDLEEWAQAVGS
ncbi:hypothetical protein Rhopal_007531-T1 [Rhodotorula paludigena]|uniref:F-box domain-containing protein n=1 Tax=Rhodotorula paludigena TaxID=86838 RepID=A0AAV5GY70_9BASI|nr:hypothetical protein Rhopal_007531-T1 [Rhodotorula paludigena]